MNSSAKWLSVAVATLVAVSLAGVVWCRTQTGTTSSEGRRAAFYQDSMHPWVKSDRPGKCGICGMDLRAVYEGGKGGRADENLVRLSPNNIAVLCVETEEVKSRSLLRTLRVAGTLEANEARKTVVAAPVACRIQALAVQYVGVEVETGQRLATLFTPELVQRRAYLSALGMDYAGPSNYMSQTGAAKQDPYSSDLLAPQSGTVIERSVYPGQYVQEGEKLLTIADPSVLWFRFDVYEQQLPWFEQGQKIEVTARGVPDRKFPAVVSFIEPALNDATRTVRLRADIENPVVATNSRSFRLLRFGMYAEAVVRSDVPDVLTVPRTAILYPGDVPYAYIEMGGGAYERRRVKLGRQGDERWEVLGGLCAGDRVVTVGNVLIDAQAQFDHGDRTNLTMAKASAADETASCQTEPERPVYPPVSIVAAKSATNATDGRNASAASSETTSGAQPADNAGSTRVNVRYARLGMRDEMRQMRLAAIAAAYRDASSNVTAVGSGVASSFGATTNPSGQAWGATPSPCPSDTVQVHRDADREREALKDGMRSMRVSAFEDVRFRGVATTNGSTPPPDSRIEVQVTDRGDQLPSCSPGHGGRDTGRR